ncbi:biopolymer transporter ExbD [Hydrogenovibrio kuenenii]|uniref:biopolymer transporter ExbD n=1 Tax=Hydrogenovibrio kuenenii TaxID=63658 RepID=UPI0004ADEEC5|nr:biopolymer transporter ExbD [Hydrogenovibrio kuenenii]
MSMRSSLRNGNRKKLMSEMNVVPYIDVTLILLIIFMITAPIVQQAVTVNLPQTPKIQNKKKATSQQVPFVISVTKEGYYKTSDDPKTLLSFGDIAAQIVARAQLHPNQQFTIQGDRLTPYQNVMRLFVTLKANGVEKVSLVTQPEQ